MGRDKAEIVLAGGETLLRRTVAVALQACDAVLVVGRARPAGWAEDRAIFLTDETPDLGPGGGLLTALFHADAPVLTLACDMPRLTVDALRWLRERAERGGVEYGIVTRNGGQIEPLFAIYMPACLPLLEAQIASGRRSLQALIQAGRFVVADAPPDVARALANANTPEELARILAAD
jgi:molybdopterin-guanine dinucleotide biosynthesis protein A